MSHDPVPVSFWYLTVRQILIVIALSFCPVLVFPVGIFFFLKLHSFIGYQRVKKKGILYNQNRQKIYQIFTENPGLRFNSVEWLTRIKEWILKYQLPIICMTMRIITFRSGGPMRYFEKNSRHNDLEKKVPLQFQNPHTPENTPDPIHPRLSHARRSQMLWVLRGLPSSGIQRGWQAMASSRPVRTGSLSGTRSA
ncbi:MAG: hypothetical protein WCF90_01275 [Methanomicrobiales archaeon]